MTVGTDLFFFVGDFFELVGTDAAEGAFIIFGQLVAFVNITADGTNKLFHNLLLLFIDSNMSGIGR